MIEVPTFVLLFLLATPVLRDSGVTYFPVESGQ